jgi:nicotinamidase-related amidase
LTDGFRVVLLADAIRAVDLNPHDGEIAINEMVRAGAIKVFDSEKFPA